MLTDWLTSFVKKVCWEAILRCVILKCRKECHINDLPSIPVHFFLTLFFCEYIKKKCQAIVNLWHVQQRMAGTKVEDKIN